METERTLTVTIKADLHRSVLVTADRGAARNRASTPRHAGPMTRCAAGPARGGILAIGKRGATSGA